jgi:hypothetical protein
LNQKASTFVSGLFSHLEHPFMSAKSNLDRESFQRLLESAFVIQQSRIDPRFLSSMLEVERLITKGDLDVDGTMNLVADSARDVAGANGVLIGLLQGDQLTYKAGSGSSTGCVGSQVRTSLTVAKTKASREILRVENAGTDKRVQGDICRQFGAEALLMLPMYVPPIGRDRNLAGVVLVLFNEAHSFQESEMRTYRLMAGLVETALSPAHETEPSLAKSLRAVPKAVAEVIPEVKEVARRENRIFLRWGKDAIYRRNALIRLRAGRALSRTRELKKIAVQRAAESISTKPLPSLALAAIVVGLGLTLWMTHGSRGATSPSSSRAAQGSSVGSFDRGSVIPVEGEAGGQNPAGSGSDGRVRTASVRRTWVAGNEIVYIGDDVTVHHFNYKSSARQGSANRVAHIGNDVTISYFAP